MRAVREFKLLNFLGLCKNRMPVATVLRIVSVGGLVLFIMAAASVGILQGTFANLKVDSLSAEGGMLDLEGRSFANHMPVTLDGEWEYFPGVMTQENTFSPELLDGVPSTLVEFPLRSVSQSMGPATYKLTVKNFGSMENLSFYLPNYHEDFAIYINGSRIHAVRGEENGNASLLYTLSQFLYPIGVPSDPVETEILISANSTENQSLLYSNPLFFGQEDDLNDFVVRMWRDDTFLIGLVFVLVIVGLVFMLLRTKLDMLSGITLFDTFLAVRIFMGFHITSYFAHQLFPSLALDRVDFVSFQYVAFFLTGTFGCMLSQNIFDPEKKLPIWPVRVQVAICIGGTIFTLLFFRSMPGVCIGTLFFVLGGSFLIVTWHLYHVIKDKRFSCYYLFQSVKTYYVGGVMTIDIILAQSTGYNGLVYLYVIFFFAHLLARLLDSNASYNRVELLNHHLEEVIEERICELTEANRRLSELSIRDPLTQAYNRLYFERIMETAIADFNEDSSMGDIYLCMFDLDYFKGINDVYGHDAGDEQLKYVVSRTSSLMEDYGTLARIGGEEFVILFTGQEESLVLRLLEDLRQDFESNAKENKRRTTASFGLAKYDISYTQAEFLKMVDECLYMAKKQGRNRIIVRAEQYS